MKLIRFLDMLQVAFLLFGIQFFPTAPPTAIRADSQSPENEPLAVVEFSEPEPEPELVETKIVPLPDGECRTYAILEHFDSEGDRLRALLPPDVADRIDENLREIYREIEEENSFVDDDGNLHCGSIVGPLKAIARTEEYERALEENFSSATR